MPEQINNVNGEVEILKKDSKRNASNQKHCNRNEECLWWANTRTGEEFG